MTCEQCGKAIDPGAGCVWIEGLFEGGEYKYSLHLECKEAADHYAAEAGLHGEEYPWFQHHDTEPEDWKWMMERHPIVATRLGWDERFKEWLKI